MASITELIEKHKPTSKPKLKKGDRHVQEAAAEQIVRMEQRIGWLAGKAARAPIRSNERKRAVAEGAVLTFLVNVLKGGES